MKVTYNTTNTRTLVPIMMTIEDASTTPSIVVQNNDAKIPTEAFSLTPQKNANSYEVNFWLEQAGDYTVNIQDNTQTHIQVLHIQNQYFLPFGVEFGLFGLSLAFAMGGLILWHKKKIRLSASSKSVALILFCLRFL